MVSDVRVTLWSLSLNQGNNSRKSRDMREGGIGSNVRARGELSRISQNPSEGLDLF